MKNWEKIAEAYDLRIHDSDLERIAPTLDALELAFRPLTKRISDDVEPATTFRILRESSE